MSIESTTLDANEWREVMQIEASFEALNERIARLSISLGIELNEEHQIHELLSMAEPRQHHDTHQVRSWTELRGLLVLRYSMEKNFAEKVGAETLKQILLEAESHLERSGFKPGADGIRFN
jgi:hypothetical protein